MKSYLSTYISLCFKHFCQQNGNFLVTKNSWSSKQQIVFEFSPPECRSQISLRPVPPSVANGSQKAVNLGYWADVEEFPNEDFQEFF